MNVFMAHELKNVCFLCVQLFATPWTVAHQAPLSMGFFRQEYWSGLPLPSPDDLPYPGIQPGSPALQADSLPPELQGRVHELNVSPNKPSTSSLKVVHPVFIVLVNSASIYAVTLTRVVFVLSNLIPQIESTTKTFYLCK